MHGTEKQEMVEVTMEDHTASQHLAQCIRILLNDFNASLRAFGLGDGVTISDDFAAERLARHRLAHAGPVVGDERRALAELTDCFLEKHGCFPLDNARWRAAMKEAYRLIGQPGTPARDAALASSPPPAVQDGKPWAYGWYDHGGKKVAYAYLPTVNYPNADNVSEGPFPLYRHASAPAPQGELREALDILNRQLSDLDAAAIPTKSEVYAICGGNARAVHDAIVTVTAALSASSIRQEGV